MIKMRDDENTDRQRLPARRRRASIRATKPHQKSQSGIPSKYIVDHSTAVGEPRGNYSGITWGATLFPLGTIWRVLQDHFRGHYLGGEHEGPSEESVRFSKRAIGPEAFSNERMVQKLFQVSMKLLQRRIFH